MKFGPIPVRDAEGAILAHATTAGDHRFRKAHIIGRADIEEMLRAGIDTIIVAKPAPDDLTEDEAASRVASSMTTGGIEQKAPATGRVNLHAAAAGVFTVDSGLIDAINAVDPSITVATLPMYAPVERGQMVATVKIIPFAVAAATVEAVAALCAGRVVFEVHPYRSFRVGLVQTMLSGMKPSVLDKTVRVMEDRLSRSGSRIVGERRVAHEAGAVSDALRGAIPDSDIVVIFGASAMSDVDDVLPAGIRGAGGTVIRAGMPVDPGNLIVLGDFEGKPVIGAPGCARSPKENGFDWVLDRTFAGIAVAGSDVAKMGVGGLLMEIPTRPQPREQTRRPAHPRVEIIVLAAGRSSRMGGPNKLLALFNERPLVRLTVERAQASKADGTIVVTGHQDGRVEAALAGLAVRRVHNAGYAGGLAGSLKVGIAAVSDDASGALIALGDMPEVSEADFDRLIFAFAASGGTKVVRATHNGKRGNPVILPRSLFSHVSRLEGDTGARHIVEAEGVDVIDVEIGSAAEVDVDTPDAMRRAGGILQD